MPWIPDSLKRLGRWMDHGVVQGSRLDYDGGPFYWQYRFIEPLHLQSRCHGEVRRVRFKPTNTACFEGGLFHRDVVSKIGFPDKRFFIYWDDCIYGYLASKVTDSVVVSDVILKRSER